MYRYNIILLCYFLMAKEIIGREYSEIPPAPMVSGQCIEFGICDTAKNYPTLLAKKLIKELEEKNVIFAEDSGLDEFQTSLDDIKLVSRFGSSSEEAEETKLCESKFIKYVPEAAVKVNSTWRFILNNSAKPIQQFPIEVCLPNNGRCSDKMTFLPNYQGVCVQGWTMKEMFYIDERGSVGKDYFKVPTCCSCKLTRTNK